MDRIKKITDLELKLAQMEEKYKLRLSRFRGVAHESAAGELAYSELKVLEDFIESIRAELEILKKEK